MRKWCVMVCVAAIGGGAALAADGVKFEIKQLCLDSNEGCAVADGDGDGKLDVIAGRNWYRNGDWAGRPLRHIEDWNGYVKSNGDHVWDLNGDGRPDVLSIAFMQMEINWFENPGEAGLIRGQLWPAHVLVDTKQAQNEGATLRDLDGDGVPEFIINSWNPKNPLHAWKLVKDDKGKPAARKMLIGQSNNSHGMGFGDINNDGREDILVGTGWYERPAGDPWGSEWTFHPDWNLKGASDPMFVLDLSGDGRNDFIWGAGHDYGLFWMEANAPSGDGKLSFTQHEIDKTVSQYHAMAWADVDGDGKSDLITGKRKWAHNGKDPGGNDPPRLFYYTWDAAAKKFTRHTIDEGRVGTGLQVRTADFNGDGKLDLAVAGKSGTFVLINKGK